MEGKNFTEGKFRAAHPRLRVVGALFLGVPSGSKSRPDNLLYLMLASSTWSMLLLALTLGGDEPPMYQAPPEGDVDDAARRPTFLSFLATAAPLADHLLLQAGVKEIYLAAPF